MLSFFPLDILDEIWDLIESVSEGFLTYSPMFKRISYSASIAASFQAIQFMSYEGIRNL